MGRDGRGRGGEGGVAVKVFGRQRKVTRKLT